MIKNTVAALHLSSPAAGVVLAATGQQKAARLGNDLEPLGGLTQAGVH